MSRWWSKERHAARRPRLIARARIAAALRGWFADEAFVEVEPAALQASPGNETHLHGFRTEAIGLDGARRELWLHTSPEFAMKKLLAAGEARIFALAPVYRNREGSGLHANEFAMLEWYRAGAPYAALMADCAAILRLAAQAGLTHEARFRGRVCDLAAEPERLSLVEAFARHAGVDLAAALPDASPDPRGALAAAAARIGVRTTPDDGWSDLFSKILSERIEPHLGGGRPTILTDYPVSEAALARPKPEDRRFAERFELYVCGVELANAFGELTDPAEQRRRFLADMDEKQRIYGERYPLDEDFLAALAQMPPASGAALGFDRLVMLATGAQTVADVQWTPD
ncbi:MAG: EF-P lysine aminoacylase GenX [Rhizobiales bacterium]|nr:EF-P lysine aminoacylase GenX [Hyphomicrobiales bacterium]